MKSTTNRLVTAGAALAVSALVAASSSLAEVGKNAGVLNPNLAGKAEILALGVLDEASVDAFMAGLPYLSVTAVDAALPDSLGEADRKRLFERMFVPIDLNTASREEILLVPGVGPRMAHEFEEYRPYRAMAQFRREIGKYVDEHEVARLEQYVFVPIELNQATEEDILTIPGVGQRMLHEFLEYRPYRSMEQFRREIGKYVDDDELARLERYVYLE